MKNDTVGIYYETPEGKIVYTYGFSGTDKTISYRFEEGGGHTVSFDEFDTWKPRMDLKDFPNSKDPVLPYEFDLYWDIKRMSQLKRALENDSVNAADIREAMATHNIILN